MHPGLDRQGLVLRVQAGQEVTRSPPRVDRPLRRAAGLRQNHRPLATGDVSPCPVEGFLSDTATVKTAVPRRFAASTATSVRAGLALLLVAPLVNATEQSQAPGAISSRSPAAVPAATTPATAAPVPAATGTAAPTAAETAVPTAAPAPTPTASTPAAPSNAPSVNTPPAVAAPELALGVAPSPAPAARGAGGGAPFSVETEPASDEQNTDDSAEKDGNQVAIYGQLLGSAVLIGPGVSYRALDAFAVDFGIGYFNICLFGCTEGITPSLQLSWLSGGNHNFEAGIGLAVTFITGTESKPFIGPHIGYRYQPTDGGFFFRALLHGPYIADEDTLIPWPGFAFGANID